MSQIIHLQTRRPGKPRPQDELWLEIAADDAYEQHLRDEWIRLHQLREDGPAPCSACGTPTEYIELCECCMDFLEVAP